MTHVLDYESWKDIELSMLRKKIVDFSKTIPAFGDLSVRQLCCMAKKDMSPIGIYIFVSSEGEILYVGKTHGRSFQERMLSHLDSRDPIVGSPHLAQFVQSLVKRGDVKDAHEGVESLLAMKIIWLPIPTCETNRKLLIAHIERRLLWHGCLDPKYNSQRVKKNDSFSIKGVRYYLDGNHLCGNTNLEMLRDCYGIK